MFSNGLNSNACTLQQHPWSALPPLLGKTAERVLGEMLLDCGVFQPFPESSNLTQISGTPLCELKPSKAADNLGQHAPDALQEDKPGANGQRGLSDIRFIRHRMLYARPMLNAKRDVSFGLGHTHVLNRCRDAESVEQDQHILRHIFPRQFNLHNVFTSEVDRTDTGQPFKDYTFREQEIAKAKQRRKRAHPAANDGASATAPLPKRLRTHALELVRRLRNHQARCSYSALLQYYCPPARLTNLQKPSIFEQASSVAQVSAFCRTVVTKVIPAALWGQQNTQIVMRHIDRFLRLRRYESLSVHDILQGIQVESVEWLAAEKLGHQSKMSQTDFKKRQELMAELLYYLFDSFLFPLIRGHFHVTESGAHRNQLFYFRHDVWKAMSEPALASLKESMLEPCDMPETRRKLSTRALGVSRIRFLPKEQGMRPIINLRRRVQKLQHGRLVLGRSINSILTPTFSILNYEKSANEAGLASALFSVEDMYPRLQAFRRSLHDQGYADKALYFAKVDVKACFDTIPQKRLLQLARQIINTDEYSIAKYARAKLTGDQSTKVPGFGAKPSWKFLTKARPGDKTFDLSDEQRQDAADGRSRTVYVNTGHQRREQRRAIIDLLDEHVEANLIKLGNRFYRQKEGIPQGSIVSSLLCSYFYSEMEAQVLGFLDHSRTMLLRLIDDFLVISTDRGVAERFMHTMHRGIQEFGVEVKSEKSLANFDVEVDGRLVGRLPERTDFPYCGNAINTVTLDLSKDKERRKLSSKSYPTLITHLMNSTSCQISPTQRASSTPSYQARPSTAKC